MTTHFTALPGQIPDEEIIREIQNGATRPFEIIIRRYNQKLYRVGMSILNNDTEAEDAMQSAYIHAYEHLHQFEKRAAFGTWLTRIMINECYAIRRKQQAEKEKLQLSNNDTSMNTPANALVNKELKAILENAIARLPEKYRMVFVLREIEHLSVKETSDILSLEQSNIKVRLNRAKTMLKENLSGYMKDHVYDFHLSRCDSMVDRVMSQLIVTGGNNSQ
ncbi:MAG: RNA polymerase sigma factor [Bacteroidetes bacterium]|nr:RNA polymerase sigma factor [Bacteroidota bacterium]